MFYSRASQRRIAKKLAVGRKTVADVIAQHEQARTGAPPKKRKSRESLLDPFQDNLAQLLERYPEITAVRMLEELHRLGFQGGYSHCSRSPAQLTPPAAETGAPFRNRARRSGANGLFPLRHRLLRGG